MLHPLHGAGILTDVTTKAGEPYYALELALDHVILYIPVSGSLQIGLRHICRKQQAQQILCGNIGPLPVQPGAWNERYRQNRKRMRSGDAFQVAQVVVCLHVRNRRRALAGSEQRMLECAEHILYSELMLACELDYEQVEAQMQKLWQK